MGKLQNIIDAAIIRLPRTRLTLPMKVRVAARMTREIDATKQEIEEKLERIRQKVRAYGEKVEQLKPQLDDASLPEDKRAELLDEWNTCREGYDAMQKALARLSKEKDKLFSTQSRETSRN